MGAHSVPQAATDLIGTAKLNRRGGEKIRGLDHRIRDLPAIRSFSFYIGPCVYFLTRNGQVVYVGKTTNLPARIGQHVNDREKHFDGVVFAPCKLRNYERAEAELIRFLDPHYNVRTPRFETIASNLAWTPERVAAIRAEVAAAKGGAL